MGGYNDDTTILILDASIFHLARSDPLAQLETSLEKQLRSWRWAAAEYCLSAIK
jgi:hypothetical protein